MESPRPISAEMTANRLFDATLSAIRDFAYTFDRDGRFLYANKALLDLWGIKLEEAVGKNFFDLNYPDDLAARLQRQIQEVFRTKKIVRDETPYLSPTGVYGVYEYIFGPVLNDKNEVEIVAGSTRDITRHKQIEQELRETQQRMEAALEGGNAGTWAWDITTNRVRIDRNVESIFVLSPQDCAVGLSVERIHAAIHPDDRKLATQLLYDAAATGRSYHAEYRVNHSGNQARWVVARGTSHVGPDGITKWMTGTMTDVTERHQAERDVRFLSELSGAVSILSGAEEITRHTIGAVGEYLNVQRAYIFEAVPQTERVLVTQNWNRPGVPSLAGEYELLQFGTPFWWGEVRKGSVTVNDTATELNVDQERYGALHIRAWATAPYTRDGEWVAGFAVTAEEPRVWTQAERDLLSDVIARIWPMIERARLIVAMRANQTMLARQREILERVVRDAPLVEILDSLAADFEQSVGRPATAAILLADETGEYLQTVAGERCDPGWLRHTAKVGVGPDAGSCGKAAFQRERVIVADIVKSPLWDSFCAQALRSNIRACWSTPILSPTQKVLGTFAVYYAQPGTPGEHEIATCDILVRTAAIAIERDLAREALKESQQKLARANEDLEVRVQERTLRLRATIEELEAFSYSISHDLRAPLRAMEGYAAILLEDEGPHISALQRDYLERIKRASGRLDQLINDILRYTRITRAEVDLREVDLNRLIRDAIDEYPQLNDKNVSIEVAPMPLIFGHEVLLSQCISNLLINAVKFVAPGIAPRVKIWAENEGSSIRVWFQDNGIGLEPKDLTRIFGMFERVNPSQLFEGTGIGLTIVKRAIERMGGKLGVESEIGKGSRFWIELPAARPEGV